MCHCCYTMSQPIFTRNYFVITEHKRDCYINISGSYGTINGNNYMAFWYVLKICCGYHGNQINHKYQV